VSVIDPAARDRPPGPLSVVLGLLTLLTAIACVAGLIIGVPIVQQYPAKISVPDRVLGMDRITDDPDIVAVSEEMEASKERFGDHSQFFAAYTDAKNSQVVAVVAGAGFLAFPESQLDKTLTEVTDALAEVGEIVEVPEGDLSGTLKCAYFKFKDHKQVRGVVCGWADHGSIGITLLFPAEDRDEAARKTLDVRFVVETH